MVVTKTATDEVNSPRLYVNTSTLQKHIKAWPNSNMVRKLDFNDNLPYRCQNTYTLIKTTNHFKWLDFNDTDRSLPYRCQNTYILIKTTNPFKWLDFNDID